MSGLGTGFFAGGLFDDGLGSLGRIGGGRQGGIGGVLVELFFQGADAFGQRGKLLLQACDDLVTLPTSGTSRRFHTRILEIEAASGCAKGNTTTRLNGYQGSIRAITSGSGLGTLGRWSRCGCGPGFNQR